MVLFLLFALPYQGLGGLFKNAPLFERAVSALSYTTTADLRVDHAFGPIEG